MAAIPRPVSSPALLFALLAGALGACSAAEHRRKADERAYAVVEEKQKAGIGKAEPFSIDPKEGTLRSNVLGPREEPPPPGPRAPLAPEPLRLTLAGALEIAAENSREFQRERETVYRAALALVSQRHNFEMRWIGIASADVESTKTGSENDQSVGQDSSLEFTKMLRRGGSFALKIGTSLLRVVSHPHARPFDTFYDLSLELPLLRGAGRAVAEENVVQAERDALYAVRDFEQFKKRFVVGVVTDYLRLLQTLDTVANEEANWRSLERTRERNEALVEAGRLPEVQGGQARQDELRAKDRWISAQARFEGQLDAFLESIGLPPDLPAEVSIEELTAFAERGLQPLDLPEDRALEVAFRNRLDFANDESVVADAARKVVVAADALRPGLDLLASISQTSADHQPFSYDAKDAQAAVYSAALEVDLPLDRVIQANAYRASLIDLEVVRRAAAASEDGIKIQVREDLRDLARAAETYEIQKNSLALAERRVDSSQLFLEAGRAETRDLLESQEALRSARNALTAALVDYTVSRLNLFRDLGVLVVSSEGLRYDDTDALLQED